MSPSIPQEPPRRSRCQDLGAPAGLSTPTLNANRRQWLIIELVRAGMLRGTAEEVAYRLPVKVVLQAAQDLCDHRQTKLAGNLQPKGKTPCP